MDIEYRVNEPVSVKQFVSLLKSSTLGERRPIDDTDCLSGMLENANLIVTAWHCDKLVGIARSVTDFNYCCYLSDLAVDQAYQHQGIGKQLQVLTQAELGPKCKLILIAAPAADTYYGKVGYSRNERCWVLQGGESLSSRKDVFNCV